MFNFRMPRVNLGHALNQFNPMNAMGHMNLGNALHSVSDAFGHASNMSPMTQALGMDQRHPNNEFDMRQLLGMHNQQQQPMQQPMHPNPMVNMSGMNMSQMMGVQPQVTPQLGNPNMGTKSGMAPMGTPMGAPMARGVNANAMNAMNALNAQRPSDAFTNPQQAHMQQMAQMIGRNR